MFEPLIVVCVRFRLSRNGRKIVGKLNALGQRVSGSGERLWTKDDGETPQVGIIRETETDRAGPREGRSVWQVASLRNFSFCCHGRQRNNVRVAREVK